MSGERRAEGSTRSEEKQSAKVSGTTAVHAQAGGALFWFVGSVAHLPGPNGPDGPPMPGGPPPGLPNGPDGPPMVPPGPNMPGRGPPGPNMGPRPPGPIGPPGPILPNIPGGGGPAAVQRLSSRIAQQ